MHIYFVRHGETSPNRRFTHQPPGTPLSERGLEEARETAEYLRSVNPDLLLTSEYTRAHETARIIGLSVGLTPRVPGFFYELVRPSSLFHRSHFSLRTIWYVLLTVYHRNDLAWHYEDAENFPDLAARVRRALQYLETLSATHRSVVVVSHTIFINVLVAYMCRERMLNFWDLFLVFFRFERLRNCGIVHVEYAGKQERGVCPWNLVPASE